MIQFTVQADYFFFAIAKLLILGQQTFLTISFVKLHNWCCGFHVFWCPKILIYHCVYKYPFNDRQLEPGLNLRPGPVADPKNEDRARPVKSPGPVPTLMIEPTILKQSDPNVRKRRPFFHIILTGTIFNRRLCDPQMTSIEPETFGNVIEGMEFHRFYFENQNHKNKSASKSIMLKPYVNMLGPDAAVICYTRFLVVPLSSFRINPTLPRRELWINKCFLFFFLNFDYLKESSEGLKYGIL